MGHRPAHTPFLPLLGLRGGEEKKLRGTPPATPGEGSALCTPDSARKVPRCIGAGGTGVSPELTSPFSCRRRGKGDEVSDHPQRADSWWQLVSLVPNEYHTGEAG